MRRFVVGMILVVVATGAAVAQKARPQGSGGDREYWPAASVASAVELVLPDVATGRAQRRPVSDLMLRLTLAGGDIDQALRHPNGSAIDRDAGLFRAWIYIVAAGRILTPVEARCDRWVDDIAVCSVACDGGAFGVRRRLTAGVVAVSMVVGRLPRALDEEAKPGFSLNACDAADAPEMLLAPTAKQPTAEIALKAR